jgi:hypothetical protein
MKWVFIIVALILIGILLFAVITQIKEHHKQDDPVLQSVKRELSQVHPIVNELSFYEGDKSYTINKEKVFMCLKDENNEYYNKNMLIYVALHEIAHALNDEIGHTEKFHKIFDELLERATELEIYDPSIPPIPNYCTY